MTPEQIQDLIAQALQPLQDEIAALREKVASLEALQEQDVTRIYTDIAQDRKRIAKLENPPAREPSKAMIDRAEKIEKYLASKPDHRATFEALRGHLGVDKARLNEAIRTLMASTPDKYIIAKVPGNKRTPALPRERCVSQRYAAGTCEDALNWRNFIISVFDFKGMKISTGAYVSMAQRTRVYGCLKETTTQSSA